MQDCFHEHPEIYGSELEDDEESPDREHSRDETTPGADKQRTLETPASAGSADSNTRSAGADRAGQVARAKGASKQVHEQNEPMSESEDLVPKAWHDGTTSNNDGK